jgi:hypothetical protein
MHSNKPRDWKIKYRSSIPKWDKIFLSKKLRVPLKPNGKGERFLWVKTAKT